MSDRLIRENPVSDEQIQAWADEAERGYDLTKLAPPLPGHPRRRVRPPEDRQGDGHDHEEREDHPHVALGEPRSAREEGDHEKEHRVGPPLADLEEEERRVVRGSDGAYQSCSFPQSGR